MRSVELILLFSYSIFFHGTDSQSGDYWPGSGEYEYEYRNYEYDTHDIVRGEFAEAIEFPSQVFIELDNGDNQCGGSLVFDDWVLTAAHCFDNNQKATRISLGSNSRYAPDGLNFTAARTCCHEDYKPSTLEHDLCLVQLSSRPDPNGSPVSLLPVTFRSLTLDTNLTYPENGTSCEVAGWGYDEYRNLPDRLMKAFVKTIEKKICAESYKKTGNKLPKATICAGHLEGGSDTCGGDSGGPLLCYRDGVETLHGVTSFGHYECGAKGFPGVYTKVANYVPWITKTMNSPCGMYHWSAWIESCSVTCGEGKKEMLRNCLNVENGVVDSGKCEGKSRSVGKCKRAKCEVHHWSAWVESCSVTCGEGKEEMLRNCLNAENDVVEARKCEGKSRSVGKCKRPECEIYHWGPWKKVCSVTCGEGVMDMTRVCLDSKNSNVNTQKCNGNAKKQEKCTLSACKEAKKTKAKFCFPVEVTVNSKDKFDNKFNTLKADLQTNLKAISEYRSVEFRSTKTGNRGVVLIDVNVEFLSDQKASRVKNLVTLYIRAFSRKNGFKLTRTKCGGTLDLCSTKPCLNEGVCKSQESSVRYQCQCKQGYRGVNCEIEIIIDPCASKPCLNEGICTQTSTSGYQCQCKQGYSGSQCETKTLDPCSRKPCLNKGVCTRLSGSRYQCLCTQEYSGSNCETKRIVDPCLRKPCLNEGVCTRLSASRYQCQCKQGYSGNDCESKITTEVQDFCFQLKSRDGLSSRLFSPLFSAFRAELSKNLRSVSGFRGVSFQGSSARSSNGNDQLIVTVRIQAATGNGKTKNIIEKDLSRYIETSSMNTGLGGVPTSCGQKTEKQKVEGAIYCVLIETTVATGNNLKLITIKNELQSSLKTFPGYKKVDFDISSEIGSIKMFVTVSTTNVAGSSSANWEGYLLYLVGKATQKNGLPVNPSVCKETKKPRNPCLPNPCKNAGDCRRRGKDYSCQCKSGYSGKTCETEPAVEQKIEEFCFEIISETPNARNQFSAFGREIRSKLSTVNGYRGDQMGGQSKGISGGREEVTITIRIRAVTSGGSSSTNTNALLWQHVDATARSTGIHGLVTGCSNV